MTILKNNKEVKCEFEKYTIQLYRALNRQYIKEDAINVVTNFIYKKLGYKTLYLDTIEKSKKVMLRELPTKDINNKAEIDNKVNYGVFNLNASIDTYKNQLYLDKLDDIKKFFPQLNKTISPDILLSTPVFNQNKLVGLLVVYNTEKDKKMSQNLKKLIQLVAKELTAVFSRIERQNLDFENMLGLTALEHVLLHNLDEDSPYSNDPLDKMVWVIAKSTGMKRCTIALIDENGKYLLPHYSTFDSSAKVNEKRYPLDKNKTKDHTAIISIETKKPVIVYDALTDPRCDPKLSKELGVRSNITLPIINIHGKAIGVIYLDNKQYEIFSKRQIRFFEIISRHIGLVISNMEYIGNLKVWSKYDGLTGLLNRRTFESLYDEMYKKYRFGKEKFSVLMLDIDNFKLTNDTYGHQIGDEILKAIANCIKENVRNEDIVARYGGEEIIIVLKDISKEKSQIIGNRIRSEIEKLYICGINVTVSIGISTFSLDSYNKDNLITIADKRLYEAKDLGKNQVIYK